MKKILISFFLISLLALPVLALAVDQPGLPCTIKHTEAIKKYTGCDVTVTTPGEVAGCCLIDKILTVGDWLFNALLVIGIIVILIAAFTFLTGGDSPDKIAKARKIIIYALIGIAIGFLAKIIVNVVASIVG